MYTSCSSAGSKSARLLIPTTNLSSNEYGINLFLLNQLKHRADGRRSGTMRRVGLSAGRCKVTKSVVPMGDVSIESRVGVQTLPLVRVCQ